MRAGVTETGAVTPGQHTRHGEEGVNGSVDIADGGAHQWRRQLTAYQRDLWMVAELFPGVPCYVSGLAAHLVGDIDIDLLVECYWRAWERQLSLM